MCLIIDDMILLVIAVEQENADLQNALIHSFSLPEMILQTTNKVRTHKTPTLDSSICFIVSSGKFAGASVTIQKWSSINYSYWTGFCDIWNGCESIQIFLW